MAEQTVYGGASGSWSDPSSLPGGAPGGGNAFFAGLEELFNSPGSFLQDSTPGAGDSGYVPPMNAAGAAEPGGGNTFLAGLEETVQAPSQAASDLGSSIGSILPGSGTVTTWLVLGVVGILGLVYISHKAL
jgi:hypothetical protein